MVPALDSQMHPNKNGASYQSPDDSGVIQPLELNGFHLTLSSELFTARRMDLPDNSRLKELRREHQDWILSWREGTLYSVPRVPSPRTVVGEPTLLQSKEHLSLIASLIDEFLPKKFPKYEAFRKRPFVFIGKKEEIVAASSRNLRSPHQLLRHFTIRPTFMLEAKIIEPIPDETTIGLFASISAFDNLTWPTCAHLIWPTLG
jgi:hypothetical protein